MRSSGAKAAAPSSARRPRTPAVEDPGAELARRFLRAYGPARPKLFADWAGLATSHATALWERAGHLAAVDLDGTKAWALAADKRALVDETTATACGCWRTSTR